jgi:hypothetical protein
LRNLLQRDGMFTARLRGEAARLGLGVIEVDTAMVQDALARRVAAALGLQAPA